MFRGHLVWGEMFTGHLVGGRLVKASKQAEACRPLTGANPAQAMVFASQGDLAVVLRELFTTLLMKNRGEK
jgi:hypothetical protein